MKLFRVDPTEILNWNLLLTVITFLHLQKLLLLLVI